MVRPPKTEKPLKIERVEHALDKLAAIIFRRGDDGIKFLPTYDRVEKELERMRAVKTRLEQIPQRAEQTRSKK